jgi:hypothetical protein
LEEECCRCDEMNREEEEKDYIWEKLNREIEENEEI